jgi:hypothetical protein
MSLGRAWRAVYIGCGAIKIKIKYKYVKLLSRIFIEFFSFFEQTDSPVGARNECLGLELWNPGTLELYLYWHPESNKESICANGVKGILKPQDQVVIAHKIQSQPPAV